MPPWPPGWRLDVLDRATDPVAPVDAAAAEIYRLFAERDQAFGVSKADEKIRPSFAFRLLDERRELAGGASGVKYAWLSTLTVLPALR